MKVKVSLLPIIVVVLVVVVKMMVSTVTMSDMLLMLMLLLLIAALCHVYNIPLFFTHEGINISICNQDLMMLKADVAVCTIKSNKDMSKGYLSSHINEKSGGFVQRELNRHPDDLAVGEVVLTSSGNMSNRFKNFLFIYLPSWRSENEKLLMDCVTDCLEKAAEKQFKSIALPALGMGGLKYPPFYSASSILKAINKHMRTHPSSSLQTIYIGVYGRNIDSNRTFLQTVISFFNGLDSGRESSQSSNAQLGNGMTLTGVETFKGLEATKPLAAKGQGQPDRVFVEAFAKLDGNMCGVQYKVRPFFSWSKRLISVEGELHFDFNKYLPRWLQRW